MNRWLAGATGGPAAEACGCADAWIQLVLWPGDVSEVCGVPPNPEEIGRRVRFRGQRGRPREKSRKGTCRAIIIFHRDGRFSDRTRLPQTRETTTARLSLPAGARERSCKQPDAKAGVAPMMCAIFLPLMRWRARAVRGQFTLFPPAPELEVAPPFRGKK